MSAKIDGVDHPVWAVNDHEAHATFQRLGFVVPPIGRHHEWGTGNICIMFERDYLEIRGVADPSRYLAGLKEFLVDGEGLIGVASGMTSAEGSHDAALQAGLEVTEPRSLRRRLEIPGKVLDPGFRNVMMRPEDHPGFFHANLCQHLTFNELRQPGWLDHPNTAVSTANVVGVTDDIENATARYETLLGKEAVSRDGDAVWLRFPSGASVELILPPEAKGRGIEQPRRKADYMASISLNVRSLHQLQTVLSSNNVPFRKNAMAIDIDPIDACGAHLSCVELGAA